MSSPQSIIVSCCKPSPLSIPFLFLPPITPISFLPLYISLCCLQNYINGLLQYVIIFVILISLSIIILRFMHVSVYAKSSFPCIAEWYSVSQIHYNFFIHSPSNEYLGCFIYFFDCYKYSYKEYCE